VCVEVAGPSDGRRGLRCWMRSNTWNNFWTELRLSKLWGDVGHVIFREVDFRSVVGYVSVPPQILSSIIPTPV
jgi:hypothetical protein